MRCEACGRKIFGKPFRVIIEGAKLTVCPDCSKHGKITWEEEPAPKTITAKPKGPPQPLKFTPRKPREPSVDTSIELVESYDAKIRQARERLGVSHEDLGKKINEKISLLRKIETGKMKPDNILAKKLERILKIKLIVPTSEEKVSEAKIPQKPSREMTLGDLIKIDKKDKDEEDLPKRKQS